MSITCSSILNPRVSGVPPDQYFPFYRWKWEQCFSTIFFFGVYSTFHFLLVFFPNSCLLDIYSFSCEWMGLSVNGGCEVTPLARQHRLAPGRSSCLTVCDWQIAAWEPEQAAATARANGVLDTGHLINLQHHQPQKPFWLQSAAPVPIYSPVFPLRTSGVEPSEIISPFTNFHKGKTLICVQIVGQCSLNLDLCTELCVSLT